MANPGGKKYFSATPHTRIAGADLSAKQYCFMINNGTTSASDNMVTYGTGATKPILGILGNMPNASALPALVFEEGEGCLRLGGTVYPGDLLTADSSGYGVKSAADADQYGAIALEYGVSGDHVNVKIVTGQAAGTH